MKTKLPKERQYAIQVQATYVIIADSLANAKQQLQTQLEGQNTIDVKVGDGQALVPQIQVGEELDEKTSK